MVDHFILSFSSSCFSVLFLFFFLKRAFSWFKSSALSVAVSSQNMVACYLTDMEILGFRDLTSDQVQGLMK